MGRWFDARKCESYSNREQVSPPWEERKKEYPGEQRKPQTSAKCAVAYVAAAAATLLLCLLSRISPQLTHPTHIRLFPNPLCQTRLLPDAECLDR